MLFIPYRASRLNVFNVFPINKTMRKIRIIDLYNVNKNYFLAIDIAVYFFALYLVLKFNGPHSLLVLPIVGAAFYAGLIGGLVASAVSISTCYIISNGMIDLLRFFVFVAVAVHVGIVSDVLKKQVAKYQLQAEKLAVKTTDLEAQRETVYALREIDSSILLRERLTNTFEMISKTLKKMTEAKACIMFLATNGVLKVSSYQGLPKKYIKGNPGKEVAEEAIKKMDSVIVQDYHTANTSIESKINTVLSAPMILDGEAIGAIVLLFEHKTILAKKRLSDIMTFVNQATIAFQTEQLIRDLGNLSLETIEALVKAIEARDPYTAGHSERVNKYAVSIAKVLKLSDNDQKLIRYAALLHDIGKLGIDDSVVKKAGPLSKKEREEMQRHVLLSDIIIRPIKFLKPIRHWVHSHQEHFDGSGYPTGLKGESIPLEARILSVADAYEAMTSNRPYRNAMTPLDALKELKNKSGTQFDPKVVKAFIKVFEKGVD